MSGVATAIGVSAAIGADSASSAANAQKDAANNASNTQLAQYNQTRQDNAPYRQAGNASLSHLQYLLGLSTDNGRNSAAAPNRQAIFDQYNRELMANGTDVDYSRLMASDKAARDATVDQRYEAAMKAFNNDPSNVAAANTDPLYGSLSRKFSQSDFQADPGYQFRMQQGMDALNNQASARGGFLSGAQLKGAQEYGQGFASNEYSNVYNRFMNDQNTQFNRLSGLAGTGQTANNQVQQAGMNMANNVSQNQIGAGNARASGYIGSTNALTSGVGQYINNNQQSQYIDMLRNRNSNSLSVPSSASYANNNFLAE